MSRPSGDEPDIRSIKRRYQQYLRENLVLLDRVRGIILEKLDIKEQIKTLRKISNGSGHGNAAIASMNRRLNVLKAQQSATDRDITLKEAQVHHVEVIYRQLMRERQRRGEPPLDDDDD